MADTKNTVLTITRLGAQGQVTLPEEYRRNQGLSADTSLFLVQVGDALVIAPCDEEFAAVTERLEARMHRAGSDVEDLIAAAAEARAEIVREEFGPAAQG